MTIKQLVAFELVQVKLSSLVVVVEFLGAQLKLVAVQVKEEEI